MRDFTSIFMKINEFKRRDSICKRSVQSWLEATPTISTHHIALIFLISIKPVGAASCRDEHFESDHNAAIEQNMGP
jgi:hypothetical protein